MTHASHTCFLGENSLKSLVDKTKRCCNIVFQSTKVNLSLTFVVLYGYRTRCALYSHGCRCQGIICYEIVHHHLDAVSTDVSLCRCRKKSE